MQTTISTAACGSLSFIQNKASLAVNANATILIKKQAITTTDIYRDGSPKVLGYGSV